jgi:hypothetical protein
MKNILIASALLLLIPVTALAGSRYDECVKEEKALKSQQAGDCSGLKYLLNPSACFATQKALRAYAGGKCRQIGTEENVEFSTPKAVPEKKNLPPASTVSTVPVAGNSGVSVKKDIHEVPQQEYSIEELKADNARLKVENNRLRMENDQLRKAGR